MTKIIHHFFIENKQVYSDECSLVVTNITMLEQASGNNSLWHLLRTMLIKFYWNTVRSIFSLFKYAFVLHWLNHMLEQR